MNARIEPHPPGRGSNPPGRSWLESSRGTPRALGGLESVIVIGNGPEIQRRSLSPVPAEETELSKTFPTAALATLALVDGRREPKGRAT